MVSCIFSVPTAGAVVDEDDDEHILRSMTMGKRIVRIGVLGAAKIAHRSFIPAIKALPEHFDLVAVASRQMTKAREFAVQYECSAVEGYEALLANSSIDAVYVPLPTGLHVPWIDLALQAGKHVYAEKSIASGQTDAAAMVARARQNACALMEGFMFQYHPQHQIVKCLLADGTLGEVRHFSASFGFPPLDPADFRYDPDIGGGVLLDAAGYPVRACHFLLGSDFQVTGAALHHDARSGTSLWGSAFLKGANGVGASVAFGFDNFYQCRYEIWGQKAKVIALRAFTPGPAFCPSIVLETAAGSRTIEAPAHDHFISALLEFHASIASPARREAHYADILLQSRTLAAIRMLSVSESHD